MTRVTYLALIFISTSSSPWAPLLNSLNQQESPTLLSSPIPTLPHREHPPSSTVLTNKSRLPCSPLQFQLFLIKSILLPQQFVHKLLILLLFIFLLCCTSLNIHIIIIVTWSSVLYHVEWMRSYHRITRDAKRRGWSNDMISSTRRDTVCQIKLLL